MRINKKTLRFLIFALIFSISSSNIAGCASSKTAERARSSESSKSDKYHKRVKFVSAAALAEDRFAIENYFIDADDLLEISVWQIEELHREVTVRPDGKISFPLIGDVQAKGKTVEGLREDIVDKIKLYIKVPQVSINIREFGGKRAVVLGKVENPGVIRFTSPIRLSEAVGLAGDFASDGTADKGSVFIIRDLPEPEPIIIVADVGKILYQADLREDIYIRQGDIIYVQTSLLKSFVDFMDNTFARLLDYAQIYYGYGLYKRYTFEDNKGRKWRYPAGVKASFTAP